jgi:cell division protein FtsA
MAEKKIAIMDIGSKEIRTVVLKTKKNNQFGVISHISNDYAGYMAGEFLEVDKLKQVISQSVLKAQKASKFSFKQLSVALGGEFLLIKTIQAEKIFPARKKMSQLDLDGFIESQNLLKENNSYVLIGCNPISYLIDEQKVSINPVGKKMFSLKAELSYVYADKKIIEVLNAIFQELGMYTVSYIAAPFAEFKSLLNENVRKDNTVIVDVGYISSHILIGRQNGILNLNSFNIGGAHIMADLAEIIKIDYVQAEHLKKNAVLTLAEDSIGGYEVFLKSQFYEVPAKIVSDIIKSRIDQIADLVKNVISNAKIDYPDYLPLFLTGGGISMIKGAKEYLQKCLGRPVEVLETNHIALSKPNQAPLFAIASFCVEKEWEISRGFLAKVLKR